MVHSIILSLVLLLLIGCGPGGEGDSALSLTAAPIGATASLAWDPVLDPSVTAYVVHYGKQSSGQSGSCAYEEEKTVTSPDAMITGLEPDTPYYFAVSAFNGLEGPCSNEVSLVTPSPQI